MDVIGNIKKELPDFKFKFDRQNESEFRKEYIGHSLPVTRAGYLLCIFLYATFGILDIWIVPETKYIAWGIRFLIVIPVLVLFLMITYSDFYKNNDQLLLIISSSIVGLGIVAMIAYSKPTELGYKYYYSGLMLVIMWIYTFIRLRFWNSFISGFIIISGYEIVAIFAQHLTDGGMDSKEMLVFINNNFFFISANIIGLWASYHIEKLHRSNFQQHQTIKEENTRIIQYVDLLQQKNEEIVAQGTEIEEQREILSIQNNELQEINATKDKFFSIIAHDLKNSFNSILAYSSLLVQELPETGSDRLTKSVTTINSSAQNAFKLLENLLAWARTQTGTIEFRQETIRLKTLLESAIDVTEGIAMNKGISLSLELNEELVVNADRNMVNTVLRNLISNAIKYTHRGGSIMVKVKSQNDIATISIIDNGVGIANDQLEKLFKISEKVSTPGTEKEPGTGLGLVLCKEFVEIHGGTLRVSSEEGKGSEFSFGLPLVGR